MSPAPTLDMAAFRAFIDEYRDRCLWFLRPDYYPSTPTECDEALRQIEQHGDREAFTRAAEFRRWLSLRSSEISAGS